MEEKEVLDQFKNIKTVKGQYLFNIKVTEYFIQELNKIIENFQDEKHEERAEKAKEIIEKYKRLVD